MDIIHRRGRVSAADVCGLMPDPPTYTTVRGLLRVLERKGLVIHEREDRRFIYRPTITGDEAATSSLMHVVRTFFCGSPSLAIAAILRASSRTLHEMEIQRLRRLLNSATSTKS